MPSDSASESKILAERNEIEEIGDPSEGFRVADRLEKRGDVIEVDGSDVKVSAENIDDRSSGRVEISGGSELLEKDAISSENIQDVAKLERKGVSVEQIGDRSSGHGEIGEGSEIVDKDVTFIERRQGKSLQDVEKIEGEVEVTEVSSEAEIRKEIVLESDIGHETGDGKRCFADVGVASIDVVQVGVVEVHNGAKVVEEGVSCLEKIESTVNDQISHNLLESGDPAHVEVAVMETAVGVEDTGEGISLEASQASEPQVMDHDGDHNDSVSQNENVGKEVSVALESVAVYDSVKLQEANVVKEPNPVDPVEDEQMTELGESKLSDEMAHNSSDGQALTAEISDHGQEQLCAESSAGQQDIDEDKLLEINQASELEAVDSVARMGDGSAMNHGCDLKDSTSKEISGGGDKKSHEARNATLDFISVDDSSKLPEADVEKGSNADDPVGEAKLQLAESVDEDASIFCNDQEESTVSLPEIDVEKDSKADDPVEEPELQLAESVNEDASIFCNDQEEVTVSLPETDVEKDSNADDPVEEPKLQLAESVNEDASIFCNDQEEAMVSHAASIDIDHNVCDEGKEAEAQVSAVEDHQKIQEEGSCSWESTPADDVNCDKVRGNVEMSMDTVIDGNRGQELEAHVQDMALTDTEQDVEEEIDSIFVPVPVDSMDHQEDRVEKARNPDVCVVEEPSKLMDEQTQADNAIKSFVDDVHQGNDPEASVSELSFEKIYQSVQEKSESLLEPVLVYSLAKQADSLVDNPNFAEPAAETEVGDGSAMDAGEGKYHKVFVSEMSLMETSQKLQEKRDSPLVLVPLDNSMNGQAGHVEAPNLADPVIESEPQIVLDEVVAGHVDAPNLADSVIESQPQVVLTETTAGHVDAPNLSDPVIELQPQVVLNEVVVGDASLLHADKEMDSDASVAHASFADHQETFDEAFATKPCLDVDAQNIDEDHVIEAPNLADHVIEAPNLADHVIEAPNLADHVIEAPNLADHVIETPSLSDQVTEAPNLADQVIEAPPSTDPVTKAPNLSDHVIENPTLVDQLMEAPYLADAVLEPQPQLTLNEDVGGKSLLDVDKEADNNTSVSHTSCMENQETNNESSSAKPSLVDNNQNIPKENDAILCSFSVGCATAHQSDNVGEFSIAADTVDEQLRLSGRETEVGDNSMRNVDQDKVLEASDLPMSLVDTNENIQREENSALDLVSLNGTLNHEADTVKESLNPINSVKEESNVMCAEAKLGDGSIVDLDEDGNHEGSQSKMCLLDHTIGHPGDHIAKNLNPAIVFAEFIEEADKKHNILGPVDVDGLTLDGSTDGELKAQGAEEKSLKKTMEKAIQSVATTFDQHVSYHLPLDKANFSFSDLVWGKVKSHPWWPGQIFDPSDASKLAMKYEKKDSFLVAYYGDKTFAWCDESQLKPFHSYFSQMEKLCSSDTFVKAIRDILMEVSRRVDLGMACSCLPEEDYTDIKHQKVENAGIRGGIINSIIDRPTVANYFQPDKLLEYIETLAQFPNGKVDGLEFLIALSQLKAFYRSKGYRELPVFTFTVGVMGSVAENPPSSGKEPEEVTVGNCAPTPPKGGESAINKREHGSKDDGKRKNISKLSEYRVSVHIVNGGNSRYAGKAAEKSILSSSGKKHIVVESDPDDSGRCKKRMLDSFAVVELKLPSPTTPSSFKIGEFIRRAASQLTGTQPVLKCQGEMLKKHDVDGVDDLTNNCLENQIANLSFTEDSNSTDDMLSQLCLAAKDPMNEYNFVSPIVVFFTGFRDFCVSSFFEDKEHVEKRKRGRPKKVIFQQASSDISLSEDEKRVEKRKRGMLMKNIISQLASSDVSSEDEKPIEKRKRGRPRKNPKPASSDSSEDKKPIQKLRRDIPNKLTSQLAPNEKRKRGRPRKVHPDIVLPNMSKPDHVKNSHWSDVDLPTERNNKNQILKQYKRRKSTGEQPLSHLKTSVSYIEQQLQLVAMHSNTKHTFVAERSIISVDEKIIDECMPTALILSFNNANSLPSETDLIRIFSRYGPLKEAETDILRKTNRAKVVFKRCVDAETAFSSAGKYSIFGPGLLSYQLKLWTPKTNFLAMPQSIQDVALVATPQENYGAEAVATAQGNQDAVFIATPQHMQESIPIITALDVHDIAPITMEEDNHDATSIITHDKCDAEPTLGSNLKLSEQEEAVLASDPMEVEAEGSESSLQGKHDVKRTNTPQEYQDQEPTISPLDEHDLAPNIIQDNVNAASIITPQDRCGEDPTEGSNVERSEAMVSLDTTEVETEGKGSLPQEKHDPLLICTPQANKDDTPVDLPQKNHDAVSHVTLQEKCNEGPTEGSSLEISEQTEDTMEVGAEGLESSPDDKHVQDNQDAVLVTPPLDQHNLTPTISHDNLDAASIITLQENCDEGPTVLRNFGLSEQPEAVIILRMMEIGDEDRESSPQDEHDHSKQGQEPIGPPLDKHNIISTTRQDNLDPSPIIALGPIVETNLELSERKKASEIDAESKELSPQDKHNLENDDKGLAISPLDEHDSTPPATHDNIELSSFNVPGDTHDAAFTEGIELEVSEQTKTGMVSETMQIEAEGNNLELSEHAEPRTASDSMQVKGRESSE